MLKNFADFKIPRIANGRSQCINLKPVIGYMSNVSNLTKLMCLLTESVLIPMDYTETHLSSRNFRHCGYGYQSKIIGCGLSWGPWIIIPGYVCNKATPFATARWSSCGQDFEICAVNDQHIIRSVHADARETKWRKGLISETGWSSN